MSLRDVFVLEGRDDAKHRELARKCARELIKYVTAVKRPSYVGLSGKDVPTAVYKMDLAHPSDREVQSVFSNLAFYIEATVGKHGRASYASDPMDGLDMITAHYPVEKSMSEKAWEVIVTTTVSQKVQAIETQLFHEFIHLLDNRRRRSDKIQKPEYDWKKVYTSSKADPAYFNDTYEYNAYVQQELEKLEQSVAKAKSMLDVKKTLRADNANEFATNFLDDMMALSDQTYRRDTQRRIVKRATQFWNDLECRFSG